MPRALSIEATKKAKAVPFAFVLDELERLAPYTRPMFGCTAVYVGERIALILRDRGPRDADNGVWIAFAPEHSASVTSELPALTRISIFGDKVAGWMKLSESSPSFEDDVMHVCERLLAKDPRFGKVPKPKRVAPPKPAATAKKPAAKKR